MRLFSFKGILHLAYVIGFAFVAIAAFTGAPYYVSPLVDRPHHDMHTALKPGGIWGHGLGIVGSAMVLLLLLYSLRKRRRLGLRSGSLSRWLDVHILFGVIGPLLITLHTAMKFGGIVSISYFSMVLVALSGVFGRYVYMQIPRDVRGHALGVDEVRRRVNEIRESLVERLPADAVAGVQKFVGEVSPDHLVAGSALMRAARNDLTRPWRVRRLRRFLKAGHGEVPERELREIVRLAREQSMLIRRMAMMDAMTRALHYWHVFHKPFAYIMIAIMLLHVGVAVSFGIILNPAVGALFMSLSTVIVSINAMLLRRVSLE